MSARFLIAAGGAVVLVAAAGYTGYAGTSVYRSHDAVDQALAEADTAFFRYQDVRQVLSDFLGVRLPP